MAKKSSIDWKKLLQEKGERIGLGAAGLIAVILIATSAPSFFHPGGGANAKTLEQKTQTLATKLASNKPTKPDDQPEPPQNVVRGFDFSEIRDPSEFAIARNVGLFVPVGGEGVYRQQPNLYAPVEGKAVFVNAQLRTYIIRESNGKLEVKFAKDVQTAGAPPGQPQPPPQRQQGVLGRPGRTPRGLDPRMGRDAGGADAVGYESKVATDWGKLDDPEHIPPVDKWLETVRPTRLAMVVAAFPYRREVQEFKDKLRQKNFRETLEERSEETAKGTGKDGKEETHYLESFRFLGVVVERREVDPKGNPLYPTIGDSGYEPFDVGEAYGPLVRLSDRQLEEDDKALVDISPDGLVMPRLRSMRDNQYPPIEKELKNIQATLADIEKAKKGNENVTLGIVQNFTDDVDPFHPGNRRVVANDRAPPPRGQPGGREGVGGRRFGRAPAEGGNPANLPDVYVPEYALIRILDVTIQPGKSYQYRIRVRMANPNFDRKDVVSGAQSDKELEANVDPKKREWFVIPDIVTVPSELHYYAVDQKPAPGTPKMRGEQTTPSRDQTTLQIHKYLEKVNPDKSKEAKVGEWAVAERIFVARGEVIDRPVRVEVPVLVEELTVVNRTPKKKELEWFRLPTTPVNGKREPGIDVNFDSGVPARPAVLVDFHGGPVTTKLAGVDVKDRSALEVLILSPDGKLLAHNGSVDTEDPARKTTYEAWKTRIEELRNAGKKDPMSTNPGGPRGPFDR